MSDFVLRTIENHGFNGKTCMFCPDDIRRKWASKFITKYAKTEKEGECYNLIINAETDDDIPQDLKDDVMEVPDLQLYVDEYIEVAKAARTETLTHLLISTVRHIEKFETIEDLDILRKIIDAAWYIAQNIGLESDVAMSITLKTKFVNIPHAHFHIQSNENIDKIKLKNVLDKKYFYLKNI
jgi:hypothetical protein